AAFGGFVLETGAYTGLPGTAGGAGFLDDPQFGPPPPHPPPGNPLNITQNRTKTTWARGTVGARGHLTHTPHGPPNNPHGAPHASGLYGSLSAAGEATLGGTLEAALVNGYSPAVNDGFNAVTYASVTGTFPAYQLPSGSSYNFASAVNPTYVGI